jgi:hypothetical protein
MVEIALCRRQLTLALVLPWRLLMEVTLLARMMLYSLSPICCWSDPMRVCGLLFETCQGEELLERQGLPIQLDVLLEDGDVV